MTAADVFIHNFLTQNRELVRRQRLRQELRRLVIECKTATDTGDTRRARKLLREADRVRAEIER